MWRWDYWLFGFPIAVFRVQEQALVYRLLPIRDEVTPNADSSWEARFAARTGVLPVSTNARPPAHIPPLLMRLMNRGDHAPESESGAKSREPSHTRASTSRPTARAASGRRLKANWRERDGWPGSWAPPAAPRCTVVADGAARLLRAVALAGRGYGEGIRVYASVYFTA